jgi:heptosyltransferase-2
MKWQERYPQTKLLILTGEAESPEILDLAGQLRSAGIACEHSHGQSLTELCRLLEGCRLYVGHDTGISHLAAACGLPCRLLFGPASPAIWIPPAPRVKVLQTDDLAALAPETFLEWEAKATSQGFEP